MNTISHSPPAQRASSPVASEAPSQVATSPALTAAEGANGIGTGRVGALTQYASPTQPSEKAIELETPARSSRPQQRAVCRESESEVDSSVSSSGDASEDVGDFLSSLRETGSDLAPSLLNNDASDEIQSLHDSGTPTTKAPALTRIQGFGTAIKASTDSVQNLLRQVEYNSFGYATLRAKAEKGKRGKQDLAELRRLREGTATRSEIAQAFDALSAVRSKKFTSRRGIDPGTLLPAQSKFMKLLDPFTGAFRDPATGLYADLRFDTTQQAYVLCFPGTGVANMAEKHWQTDFRQFLGTSGVPQLYRQASELADTLNQALATRGAPDLQLTGHSMGGGIANYVGLSLGLKSTCFNAAALGGACLDDLSARGRLTQENIDRQTHIRLKGDAVSSPKAQKHLTAALKRLGVRIQRPTIVGTVHVASADKPAIKRLSAIERHQMTGIGHLYT